MTRYADVVDTDECFYLSDDALDDQTDTLTYSEGKYLDPGEGILRITTQITFGLVRIEVETFDDALPPESTEQWDGVEEAYYRTQLGLQRVRSSELEECQGELAGPVTQPGPAIVHVRAHWNNRVQPPSPLGVPVVAHYLLHIRQSPVN
ncbi:hypothetical protein ACHIPZ_13475 [Antrihabitans sp. NCIMB 15449]|uniref:Uncharacterized protein n=1 Tax=Antrihabitans spumae TaxID=3373370 RepID=A0ABW7JMJ9_9NOCA